MGCHEYPDTREHAYGKADRFSIPYIVNFEDEQGAALVGADPRADDVPALTDAGSMTAAKFDAAALPDAPDGSWCVLRQTFEFTRKLESEELSGNAAVPEKIFMGSGYLLIEPMLMTKWSR